MINRISTSADDDVFVQLEILRNGRTRFWSQFVNRVLRDAMWLGSKKQGKR